eukprot:scaffold65400_cov17-Tisochrysis_lutea.AAC.2
MPPCEKGWTWEPLSVRTLTGTRWPKFPFGTGVDLGAVIHLPSNRGTMACIPPFNSFGLAPPTGGVFI